MFRHVAGCTQNLEANWAHLTPKREDVTSGRGDDMKSRSEYAVCATVVALTVIGCCASSMAFSQKRRVTQHKQLEEAMQNWEGEGGALPTMDEDEEKQVARV
jgi:hypothetical protein